MFIQMSDHNISMQNYSQNISSRNCGVLVKLPCWISESPLRKWAGGQLTSYQADNITAY